LPAPDVSGAGVVVAAAPGIAESLLLALRRAGALEPLD